MHAYCVKVTDVTQYVAGGWFSARFPLVGGGLKPPPTNYKKEIQCTTYSQKSIRQF